MYSAYTGYTILDAIDVCSRISYTAHMFIVCSFCFTPLRLVLYLYCVCDFR